MKKIVAIIFIIFILILVLGNNIVNADMGPKPSITIHLKGINTTNYIIDLLVYDEEIANQISSVNDMIEKRTYPDNALLHLYNISINDSSGDEKSLSSEDLIKLAKVNDNGWVSESTRWGKFLLMSDIMGNSKYENYFKYFGTPETYKVVIINNDSGETKISNVINRVDFNSKITIDYDTMVVKNNISGFSRNFTKVLPILIPVIMTVIIEIIVLACFKMTNKRNTKTVVITNIISNIILQLLLIKINKTPNITGTTEMNCFFIFEILIIIAESFIYYKTLENEKSRKTILYAIIANLISGFFTFWEWILSMKFF